MLDIPASCSQKWDDIHIKMKTIVYLFRIQALVLPQLKKKTFKFVKELRGLQIGMFYVLGNKQNIIYDKYIFWTSWDHARRFFPSVRALVRAKVAICRATCRSRRVRCPTRCAPSICLAAPTSSRWCGLEAIEGDPGVLHRNRPTIFI